MDSKCLPALPGTPHNRRVTDRLHLRQHIELADSVHARLVGRQGRELLLVLLKEIADRRQPMLDEPMPRAAVEDCANAAATIVSADDNVFDLERLDRKLQNGHAIEVRRIDEVRNVAVHPARDCQINLIHTR